ncbi:hypothetical protein L228DRAFT_280750 [Xylona heveae TC161]|uniref:Mitotic-spindle organizing protein 1 n=1 Tax=Xylona heveae (strain CBS 132557 / TC161) TaxID=1328760 RepID=A0A165IXN3_XYLHT|nr:hypothetical protein L228DRAFT_280750 [Xylona heveae TC161]KZF25515.1 hypothetical protein L228DRAFT_280750 [Xylona heveae TC161]
MAPPAQPQPSSQPADSKRAAAREVIDILQEISTLLDTKLDRTTLSLCVSLIENGVNPEALANVVKELRREGDALRHQRDHDLVYEEDARRGDYSD